MIHGVTASPKARKAATAMPGPNATKEDKKITTGTISQPKAYRVIIPVLFGFIFLITQYFQFVKGYSTLSAGLHTLPFAIVAAVFTPIAAVVALRVGTRLVVVLGLLLMGGGLVVAAFNSSADTTYYGPIIIAMVLLALGLSSITAPTAEAVMGSVSDEQRGAAAGVNNTTRELGGTLGVAVFGSIFASSYAPKIISAFRPLPIPAGPKAESHQSMAAALAVVGHAPRAARPALESIAFNAFHSGLQVACIAGAGVAVLGALAAFRLLPGGVRRRSSWRRGRRRSRRR